MVRVLYNKQLADSIRQRPELTEVRFVLKGVISGGKNNMGVTRTGIHYPNPKFKAWRDSVLPQIPRVRMPKNSLGIEVKYWNGDLRRRDVSGLLDAIFHCLELKQAGVIVDDSLIEEVHWLPMGLDRLAPRAEIRLWVRPNAV